MTAIDAFAVRHRSAADHPAVWNTIPVAYRTLDDAAGAAKAFARANLCPDATLVTTEPPGGETATVDATAADGRAVHFAVERVGLMVPPGQPAAGE